MRAMGIEGPGQVRAGQEVKAKIVEVPSGFAPTLIFTFTATGQVLPQTLTVPPDADFFLVKITHTSTDNVDVQAIAQGGGLLQLIDEAEGRNLMGGNPAPLDAVSGRAQRPYILPNGYRFRRQSTITAQITNQGLAAQVIRLTLHGFKLYFRAAA